MMTAALIAVAAAWLLSLLWLALDLAGRPWRRSSRLRSAGGLLMCTGALIDLLVRWPAHPWAVGLLGLCPSWLGLPASWPAPSECPRPRPPLASATAPPASQAPDAVPVACPIGRSVAMLHGYSRTSRPDRRPAGELAAARLFAHSQADSPSDSAR